MKNLWCHPGLRSSSRRRGSIHLVFALFLAFFFVACGDDDSDFATRPSDGSSSSVCGDCDDGSSSSVKSSSSSASQKTAWDYLNPNIDYGEMVDSRDGQTYKMVKIGDQVWMAENLNYEVDSSFCYSDSAEYCEKYGRLYRWAAAVGKLESECGYGYRCSLPSGNIQGVCPSGWHLPSKTEWFDTVGGKSKVGKVLKSTSGWNSSGNGTDAFGFSALPAGSRLSYGGFDYEGNRVYFWSSTEDSRYRAYVMDLYYNSDYAYLDYCNKYYAFSVRCLQD